MKPQTLESETFGSGSRSYFIDFSKATNQSEYIKITRSDKQADNTYKKNSVIIFEEDFSFLIESFSMLFTSVIHRKEKNHSEVTGTHSNAPEFRKRGIKSWAPEKRPREKLMEGGAGSVSTAELLALLIGSGTTKETAVDLAARIQKSVGGDLNALSELPLKKLTRFQGIGEAKAVSIMAAMELSNRRDTISFPFKLKAG
ncbi:UPF0758 domain-containing protein [Pedobacter nyackensis]|uniref:UPF0758 domain-containing protein n=1 Tax=Pedobacter nyackensis TaxID=475255 RepID=UPI00292E4D18|nr:UPF0758 domain-containing protein [Pedobacter nyackensis]